MDKSEVAVKKTADITIGCWIVAKYNNLKYPGQVLSYDDTDNEFEIKTMSPVLYKGEKYLELA